MRSRQLRLTFAILSSLWSPEGFTTGSATQSVNPITGVMDVDYAGYLSQHDVVFNQPILDPAFGSTVGNGRLGAMVWNQDGLRMQISDVDASEQTAFSAGLIHLYTSPALDGEHSRFRQRLSLYDGTLTTKYGADRTITVMGVPHSELLGIHVADSRRGVSQVTLDLGIWDVSNLIGGDVRNIATWRSVATYADSEGIGLSRGQQDPDNFGYTLAATVEGSTFRTQTVDPNTVRLIITPSAEYTIWIACASRYDAPDHDSVRQAHSLLSAIKTDGYTATLARYERGWHAFWHKSFVRYSFSGDDAGYLENLYYLYTYIIAAGSYSSFPFHFMNGDLSANGDSGSTRWASGYWHWNERDVYGSFLASNHPEILHVLNQLYQRNFEALRAHTRARFHIDGIWVPEVIRWDGDAGTTERSDWTKDIFSTGAEVAENMYAEYEYTNDAAYLRKSAYPFIRAVTEFYAGVLALSPESGRYHVTRSNAHETYWGVTDAITDLAAVRSLFPIAIAASEVLGADGERRIEWRRILEGLAPYPLTEDGARYAPHAPPPAINHNWENITSELVWPYGVTGIDAGDYRRALDGWINRPYPYGNIWSPDAIQAARLGLGDEVLKGLKRLIGTYQTYPNGLTDDSNGRFEYLGSDLSAVNESLLQSHDGKIRVFPAPPSTPEFDGKFTLLARGAFLLSSEYQNNETKYVVIRSLAGNRATLENPWRGGRVRVRRSADNTTLLTTTQDEFSFDTTPNTVYVIERLAKPLNAFSHRRLTGTANVDAKRLAGSPAMLGAFRHSTPDVRFSPQ